jgi:hypothetical protein
MATVRSIALFLVLAFAFSQSIFAQEKPCHCWVDENGKSQPSAPASGVNYGAGTGGSIAKLSPDGKSASNSKTGHAYEKTPEGCWIDEQGKSVPSAPASGVNYGAGTGGSIAKLSPDGKSATNSKTGHAYERVPCPPPDAAQQAGHTIKKILEHVSIGVGVSGGTIGGEDHKGNHHVTNRQHTSSTTKKLPAGCKCHPCTCSPCTCH